MYYGDGGNAHGQRRDQCSHLVDVGCDYGEDHRSIAGDRRARHELSVGMIAEQPTSVGFGEVVTATAAQIAGPFSFRYNREDV